MERQAQIVTDHSLLAPIAVHGRVLREDQTLPSLQANIFQGRATIPGLLHNRKHGQRLFFDMQALPQSVTLACSLESSSSQILQSTHMFW